MRWANVSAICRAAPSSKVLDGLWGQACLCCGGGCTDPEAVSVEHLCVVVGFPEIVSEIVKATSSG